MSSTILSDEEIEMIRILTTEPQNSEHLHDDITADLIRSMMAKAQHVQLDIHLHQYHLRFPIQQSESHFDLNQIRFGTPEIYEYASPKERHWRIAVPTETQLLNEHEQPFQGTLLNISTSGLLLKTKEKNLQLGHQFSGTLKRSEIEIKLMGYIVRSRRKSDGDFEWAVQLSLKSEEHEKLQQFIFMEHSRQNESTWYEI